MTNYADTISLTEDTVTAIAGPFDDDQEVIVVADDDTVYLGFTDSITSSLAGGSFAVADNGVQQLTLEAGTTLYALSVNPAVAAAVLSWRKSE